ncbi:glycerophosphodiester phosphodiesterase [Georgenia deserti]|uniref:Glycerophosphodiester phosphodiesterase n=1 Tax=Georgenia deserti TaxID=2093781 RepID=A0ABW4L0L4_9MICO
MSIFLAGPEPVALAHRGGSLEAPENSRAAVEHTRTLGLRYLETDVRATRDGVAVLLHDPTLDRVTDGHGRLRDLTWEQVSRLRDASGDRPVRLDELLGDYPDLRVNIDAKESAVIAPLVRAVVETRAQDRICLASFSDDRLRILRTALGPGVATSLGQAGVATLLAAAQLPELVRRRAVQALPTGAVCVQVPPRHRGLPIVTDRFLTAAHSGGLAVHVWTIDDPAEMNRLLDLGVDGLVTDRPGVLKDVLIARGVWR